MRGRSPRTIRGRWRKGGAVVCVKQYRAGAAESTARPSPHAALTGRMRILRDWAARCIPLGRNRASLPGFSVGWGRGVRLTPIAASNSLRIASDAGRDSPPPILVTSGFQPRAHTHTPTHSPLRNDTMNMVSIRSDTVPSHAATHPGDHTVWLCNRLVTESATHLGHGRRRPARSAAASVTRWGTLRPVCGRRYSLRLPGGMRRQSHECAPLSPLEGSLRRLKDAAKGFPSSRATKGTIGSVRERRRA